MNLECLNNIITNRLAIHVDISNINSWNLNSGFTSMSLTKWSNAKSDNLDLYDFGLTAYDNGRVDSVLNNLELSPSDLKLQLFRIGNNNSTGETLYNEYQMSGITTENVGNYFELNGGYLQGFFKLQDENYEIFPPRFGEGITIENIIRIDLNSSGIFYYMGSRSEDKYNPFFSGETIQTTTIIEEPISTGQIGESGTLRTEIIDFSGVTTSQNNNLNAYLDEEVKKKAFSDFANSTNNIPIEQPNDSINNNVIAFGISTDKKIFIRTINSDGLIDTRLSPQSIQSTGWTIITQIFNPYEIIMDDNDLKCASRRKGDLVFYINGRQFWKLTNIDEYYFVDIKNHKEKTYGVPYTISWGGGSFGLKHSWHFDNNTVYLYSGNNDTYIQNNFVVKDNPINDDPCLPTGDTKFGTIVLGADSDRFEIEDICGNKSKITVMSITYTGTSTQTTNNEYYFEFANPINLISNRDYNFSVDVFDDKIFQPFTISKISIIVYGTEDFEIIDENPYTKPPSTEKRGENRWVSATLKGKVKDNTGKQIFRVGILIESNKPLNNNFKFYINNFKYSGSDILNNDLSKNNLLIQQNFDESYIGAIQKLRIYDIAFDNSMVFHNAKIESINNPNYGLSIKRGGRLITQ